MKEVIRNESFEKSMTELLNRSCSKVQAAVDAWKRLELTSCESSSDLYDLLNSPQIMFQEGVNKALEPPLGLSESEQRKHLEKVRKSQRTPSEFYMTCEHATLDPYVKRELRLLDMKDGAVALAPAAKDLVKQKSVYARNDNQEKLIKDIQAVVKQLAELSKSVPVMDLLIQSNGSVYLDTDKLRAAL